MFFLCYLAARRPTLGHYQGDNLTVSMLITALFKFRSQGHQEPHNKVDFQSLVEQLVGSEPKTFQFYHNTLTH